MKEKIYLDHNATTYICQEAKDFVNEYQNLPLNASSIHYYGRKANMIMEQARTKIASNLNIDLNKFQIIFTSSGTEANNLTIKGLVDYNLIYSATEHVSTLLLAKSISSAKVISVDEEGIIDFIELENYLKISTAPVLVSVMLANNETGVIQDIKKIADLVHKYNGIIHTDAIQALGKIKVDIEDLGVDLMTISSHKFGGLIGAAALIIRKKITIQPQIVGGGQEKSFRAGTENILAIGSFGMAVENIEKLNKKMQEIEHIRNNMEIKLKEICNKVKFFGSNSKRLPNTSLIMMPDVNSQTQLINFDLANIGVSAGSACSSGRVNISHVLLAMGVSETQANMAIRVSLGINNNQNEIDYFVENWKNIYLQSNNKKEGIKKHA